VALEISPSLLTISLTKTRQLTATARVMGGNVIDQPPIEWSSSDEAVVSVTQTGLVTAVGLGQAQIRVAFAGQAAVAQVTVVGLVLRDAIVYETEEFGAISALNMIRPDGSSQTRLTTDGRIYLDPDVSPDGRRIAFSGPTARFGVGIFVMNADGSDVTSVVDRSFDTKPSWSPDGTRIAFLSNNDGPFGPVPRVFVVNVDGTGLRQLSPEHPDPNFWFFDDSPSWSPDGSQVLFLRAGVLHVIDADGTDLTALPTEEVLQSAEWSPDGARIATTNNFDQIEIRNADGSDPVAITLFPLRQQKSLRWSPDSRKLVFCRKVDDAFRLFTINVDGTDEKQLATTPNARDCMASWSPVP
jgi:Tol biopolymer transport system component